MKKIFIVLLSLLISVAGNIPVALAADAVPPSLQFSDITSGPAAGGKDDLGAIITVAGKNFGAQQSSGYVSVGGVKAAAYLYWSDTKISFQPGASAVSGEIKVTTAGGTSNGLPFTVRSGNIYFVDDTSSGNPGSGTFTDPWRSPSTFLGQMKPGDIAYFRGGTYGNNITLGSGQSNGTAGNEIAFIGYPGETATVSSAWADFDLQDGRQYFVIAGFKLYSDSKNVSVTGSHIRIINNNMESLKTHSYGMIHPTIGSDIKIYGNTFSGATSGNKLDHPIYVGYGADNVDIGWNRIYNNNVDRGPVISVNTDGAQQSGYKFDNIRIHDNEIDCNGARGIGVVCTQAGSSVRIYNNIFTGSSDQVVYVYSGSVSISNNVFYVSPGGSIIQLTTMNDGSYTYWPETIDIKNNILYSRNGGQYFEIINENEMGKVDISNNAYYGAGSGPSRDAQAKNTDPLFVNAGAGNFYLSENSPCINAGTDVSSLTVFDKDGYARSQEGVTDMGVYEHGTSGLSLIGGTKPDGVTLGQTTPDGEVPDLPSSFEPVARVNDILVLGSTLRRGTINPDKGETAKIYFRGKETGTYHARVFTLAGDLVWETVKSNVSEGMFEWVPRGMASAVYVVNVLGPGMKATKKLAIVN